MNGNDGLDDHGRPGHVLIGAEAGGGHGLDAVHDVLPLNDLAEHGVAVPGGGVVLVVQEIVVRHVDEELRRGGVGIVGAGHRDGVGFVLEAVSGFIDHGLLGGGLFLHVGGVAAALNHEPVDDAVEDRVVVEPGLHIIEEVADRLGGLGRVQLDDDVAHAGFDFDLGLRRGGVAPGGQQAGAEAQGQRENGDTKALHNYLHVEGMSPPELAAIKV